MTTDEPERPVLRVSGGSLRMAQRNAIESIPNELGGILVGWWEGPVTAVAHDLLVVSDKNAGPRHYTRREAEAQRALDDYLKVSDDPRVGYIGEWHSHPQPEPQSGTDRAELAAIVRLARRPVAMLVITCFGVEQRTSYSMVGTPRWPRRATIQLATTEVETP